MTNQTTNNNTLSVEAILAAINAQAQANGSPVQPLTNEQLMALLQAAANGQQQAAANNAPAQEPVKEAPKFTYEYVEITDLHVPHLTDEEKAEAIALANKIEKIRMSTIKRQEAGIQVPDIEIDNLSAMLKDFRKLTGVGFFGIANVATRGLKQKVGVFMEKAEVKSEMVINGLEETADDVIDSVVALGVETIKFGGVFAKGTLNIGSTATKGLLKTGFGLFR